MAPTRFVICLGLYDFTLNEVKKIKLLEILYKSLKFVYIE